MSREELIVFLFNEALHYPKDKRREVVANLSKDSGFDDDSIVTEVVELIGSTSTTAAAEKWSYFAEFREGELISDRFRILRKIGEGGMGTVYEVNDDLLGIFAALKTIKPEWTADPNMQERFLREIKIVKGLNHPNVCRIFEVGTHKHGGQHVLFFTMELLKGATLQEELKTSRFRRSEALPLLKQIGTAIDHVHDRGVIHRDLKPRNIFLMPETNGSRRAVVMDFGIARQIESGGGTQLTRAGDRIGTDDYSSPEQLAGKPASNAADLFALGLIAHLMVTGKLSRRVAPSILQVLVQPRAALWAWAVGRCLADEPAERWASAADFTRALARPIWPLPAFLAVCVIAGFLAAWLHRPEPAVGPTKTLAVMPFDGPSSDLASGTADALARHLSLSKILSVEYGSAIRNGRAGQSVQEIAHDYDVSFVLNGTAQQDANRFVITMTLSDSMGHRVWHGVYKASRDQLLALEKPIYDDLATALQIPRERQAPVMEDPQAYFDLVWGRAAIRDGDPKKAIEFFTSALRKNPRMAEAEAAIADAYLALYRDTNDSNYTSLAAQAAEQAQTQGGATREVYLSLGTLYQTLGNYDQAADEVRRAIAMDPGSAEGYRRLGRVYLAQQKQTECIQAYEKALSIRPNYWNNYVQIGNAYFQFGDNDQAMESYRHAAELEPHYALPLEDIGNVYFREGRFVDAAASYHTSLEIEKTPRVYSNLGTVYYYMNDFGKAISAFQEAVNRKQLNHQFRGNLADAYSAKKQRKLASDSYREAIALAYRALDVNPKDALALAGLAKYHAKTGQTNRAEQESRKAHNLAPENADVLYQEAIVDVAANRFSDAVTCIRATLKHGYTIEQVRHEPDFIALRAEPAFQQLVGTLNTPAPK